MIARRSGSVLVVEDEGPVRNLIARWMRGEGHECAAAPTATDAWEAVRHNDFDVATLDITMPGEQGTDFLVRLRKRCPDIEVLMLTAVSETQTAIHALTNGAYAYLMKPLEREELVLQVQQGLERRRLRLQNREHLRCLETKVFEQTQNIRRANEELVFRLIGAASRRDEETGLHMKRVGLYSECLARAIGWNRDQAALIRMAAPLHDVGKIAIPDAILRKPGHLTVQEFQAMQAHTTIGADLLSGSNSPVLEMASQIAHCHHERWDGQGYPCGMAGEAIPEAARIVTVADVFDAMTQNRVYRRALDPADALIEMSAERGCRFDPDIFDMFLSHQEQFQQIRRNHPDDGDASLSHPANLPRMDEL